MTIECTMRCCRSRDVCVIINYKPGWHVQNLCVSCVLGAVHNSRHFIIRHLSDDDNEYDDDYDDGDNDDNDGDDEGDKWL